jgi:hypothetical protein
MIEINLEDLITMIEIIVEDLIMVEDIPLHELCLNKTYPLPCCTVKMHEVEVVITREQRQRRELHNYWDGSLAATPVQPCCDSCQE